LQEMSAVWVVFQHLPKEWVHSFFPMNSSAALSRR
jgi:hypothetical protein